MTAVAAALTVVLSVAGCSPSAEPAAPGAQSPSTGAPTEDSAPQTEHNAADVGFAQLMIVHHQGAIDMAELATTRAAADDVRALAGSISAAQGPEIEQMTGWLDAWGEATAGDGEAHGGDHGEDHGGTDPGGLDMEAAMEELESLSGPEFDRAFLETMITHHEGAVVMAQAELADGAAPEAMDLAEKIIEDQNAEIAQMEQMLQGL